MILPIIGGVTIGRIGKRRQPFHVAQAASACRAAQAALWAVALVASLGVNRLLIGRTSPSSRTTPGVATACDTGLHRTPVPVEKNMMSLPEYVVEAPDILTIDALKVVAKPPYKIEPLDILQVTASGTRPEQPISGNYSVDPSGAINLGAPYGWVRVSGMTLEEASQEVEQMLQRPWRARESP